MTWPLAARGLHSRSAAQASSESLPGVPARRPRPSPAVSAGTRPPRGWVTLISHRWGVPSAQAALANRRPQQGLPPTHEELVEGRAQCSVSATPCPVSRAFHFPLPAPAPPHPTHLLLETRVFCVAAQILSQMPMASAWLEKGHLSFLVPRLPEDIICLIDVCVLAAAAQGGAWNRVTGWARGEQRSGDQ